MKVMLDIEKFLAFAKGSHMDADIVEYIVKTYEDKVVEIDEDVFRHEGKYKVRNFDGFSVREDSLIALE